MRARLIVVVAFVLAAAVCALLAYRSGIIPARGAANGSPRHSAAEFRVTALAWPGSALGLAATPERVVWEQRTADRATGGLWSYEVGERRTVRLLARAYVGRSTGFPSASGSTVVWVVQPASTGVPTSEVRGFDSATRRRFLIATGGTAPALAGDLVVWIDTGGRSSPPGTVTMGRDLVTDRRFVLHTRVPVRAVAAQGSWVILRAGSGAGTQVWAVDRTSGGRWRLSSTASAIAVDGQRALWAARDDSGGSAIMAWDLSSHTTTELCRVPGTVSDLTAGDGLVAWVQDSGDGDIGAYDLTRRQTVAVCTDPAAQASPVIVGRTVFWADRRSGRWELYGSTL